MISFRRSVLWASLLASAAFAASAQPAAPADTPVPAQTAPAAQEARPAEPGQPRAERSKRDPAQRLQRHAERQAKRLAALKDKLQLSSAQEPAWAGYAAALQPQPLARQPGQRPAREAWRGLSTPERLDRLQAFQAERSARFAQYADATRRFYAQLSPEQQKTFDAETAKRHGPRHGQGGHLRHPGGERPAAPARS